MLELRPLCENCAAELPPDSTESMIGFFWGARSLRVLSSSLKTCAPIVGRTFRASYSAFEKLEGQ